ncbi:MAG: EAL domain-containing protein [Butyrivibrio sp.]|nr:EAL domain-containing protein [Butyrivibrio sp.]
MPDEKTIHREEREEQKQRRLSLLRWMLTTAGMLLIVLSVVWLILMVNRQQQGRPLEVEIPSETAHRVLFIGSYTPQYFTYESQAAGIEEGLYPNDIEYDVVYMDAKVYPGEDNKEHFRQFLESRLQGNPRDYEAILVGDDDALLFAMEYGEQLFPGLPIVFFGINSLEMARSAEQLPLVTGFYETDYLRETLDAAIRMFPNSSRIVALHDRSAAGEADMNIFYEYARSYPAYIYTDINTAGMTRQKLVSVLEMLPEDTILIYMTCYTDSEGNTYSVENMTKTIVESAHCPVFRNYEIVKSTGVVGGVYMDMRAHAKSAAERASQILNGADPADFTLETYTPSRSSFDYQQLKKYGVDVSLLPKDAEIRNQPESFLTQYGRILLPMGLILTGMILFTIANYISVLMGKRANEALRISRDSLEISKDELMYQAEHDDFLDMYNRRTMQEKLQTELTPDMTYAIVMADLDGFKEVNESYGHQVADEILRFIAGYLETRALEMDWLLARYGGDEFLLMIPGEHLHAKHPLVEELLEAFRMPIPLGDVEVSMSASMGISNSDGETTPAQHVQNAELAMYEAKARGRNGAFVYDEEMKERAREENRTKEILLDAFDNNGFFMVYQPQINAMTREVSGYEALIRMKAPGMYPGKFIPIAEANGWIWRIGRITTELVIRQLAAWRDEGHELHPVSINFSSNQLNDTGYLRFLEETLKLYDIPARYVEIEITEGVFLDRTATADSLFSRFKELGIRLLMDDFGTGYSSLAYLTYIPVDVIKLDKSLVDNYLVDGKDSFIRDVITMVHDLNMEMIIEGVEEEWQYERLKSFGAETIQGYYFSKPLPPEEAIVFTVP